LVKQSKMPIDCASADTQPCTGSMCVHDQVTRYCQSGDGSEGFPCDNDSQVFWGGPIICCTGKNVCHTCMITINGQQRPFVYYNFTGVSGSCTPNGPY
jgi:hypothetical protein